MTPNPFALSQSERRDLRRVALGELSADLFVRGGTVVNVYSGELVQANVAVLGERIAYVGPDEHCVGPATEIVEARGRYVSPGWIEPHSHAYLGYNPASLAEAVLPGGTTTIACDDLVFSVAGGARTSRAVMDACAGLPVRYLWYARPEPATPLDGDEERFDHGRLRAVLDHRLAVGVGEAPAWARFLTDPRRARPTARPSRRPRLAARSWTATPPAPAAQGSPRSPPPVCAPVTKPLPPTRRSNVCGSASGPRCATAPCGPTCRSCCRF